MTTFRDHDGTIRLSGDLLMPGTAGDVLTILSDGTVGPGAGGGPQQQVTELSSAMILAMFDTPVELLAAPGAGIVPVMDGLAFASSAGVEYSLAGDIQLNAYGGSMGPVTMPLQTQGQVTNPSPVTVLRLASGLLANVADEPVTLEALVGNPTDGTLTVRAILTYYLLDFS